MLIYSVYIIRAGLAHIRSALHVSDASFHNGILTLSCCSINIQSNLYDSNLEALSERIFCTLLYPWTKCVINLVSVSIGKPELYCYIVPV